ncbi:MAG: imidazoleglycerol-phosphate dehydratase HisB [Kiritimatiellae bacterium]|nr:imidazoleglycerol-phosphate dehydratase HisB [Kiritimatiellia bacterium]
MKKRMASKIRHTRETQIDMRLNVDGTGQCDISTGIGFMDHMLELLGRHALIDLHIRATGDLQVDYHHTVEDLGLVLGDALNEALGDRAGITRYGWALLPMDDTLSRVALDLGGRPYLVYQIANRKKKIVDFDVDLIREFFQAFTVQGRLNLHIAQLYGKDVHHAYESVFKGLARALRMACGYDAGLKGAIPSSKGVL